MKSAEYKSELTKGTPNLVQKGELWVFIVRILEKIDCIIIALYL